MAAVILSVLVWLELIQVLPSKGSGRDSLHAHLDGDGIHCLTVIVL
jgi:hypothetical protein